MSEQDRPKAPVAGLVYGETIYWGTVISAVIAIIGSVVNFVTTSNHILPSALLSKIWQGQDVTRIWEDTVGARPDGHWYLDYMATGDGLATFGLAFGVFIVIPAIFGSAYVLFRDGDKFFASVAAVAGLITVGAMVA